MPRLILVSKEVETPEELQEFSKTMPQDTDAWRWYVTWDYPVGNEAIKWAKYEQSMLTLKSIISEREV